MPNIITTDSPMVPSGGKIISVGRGGQFGHIKNPMFNGNNRAVVLGTSITISSSQFTNNLWRFCGSYTESFVQQSTKWKLVHNAGVGGNTSAQILARFDTDVTPYYPGLVLIECLTNDLPNFQATYSAATVGPSLLNLCAIIEKTFEIGAIPVVVVPPPSTTNTNAAKRVRLHCYDIARFYGIRVIDTWSTITDATTGTFKTNHASDGVHPLPFCMDACIAAQYGTNVLDNLDKPNDPYFGIIAETAVGDISNKVRNGCYVLGTFPAVNGWTTNPTNAVATQEAVSKPFSGYTFKYVKSVSGAAYAIQTSSNFTLTQGDLIEFNGRIKISGVNPAVGAGVSVTLGSPSGYLARPLSAFKMNMDCTFSQRFVCAETGVHAISYYVTEVGTYEFNNSTVVNLTELRAIFDPGYAANPDVW